MTSTTIQPLRNHSIHAIWTVMIIVIRGIVMILLIVTIRYRNQFQALLQFICNLCLALLSLQYSPGVCLFIHAQFMHIGSRRIYEHAAEPSANISDFLQLTLIYLCLLFHLGMLYFSIIKEWHACRRSIKNKIFSRPYFFGNTWSMG